MKTHILVVSLSLLLASIQPVGAQIGRSDTSKLPDKIESRQVTPRGTNSPYRSATHHVVGGRVLLECLTYRSEDGSQVLRRAYTVFDPLADVDPDGVPKPPILPIVAIFQMISPETRLSASVRGLREGWVFRSIDDDQHGSKQWALSDGTKVIVALIEGEDGEIRPMTRAEYEAKLAARVVRDKN